MICKTEKKLILWYFTQSGYIDILLVTMPTAYLSPHESSFKYPIYLNFITLSIEKFDVYK